MYIDKIAECDNGNVLSCARKVVVAVCTCGEPLLSPPPPPPVCSSVAVYSVLEK